MVARSLRFECFAPAAASMEKCDAAALDAVCLRRCQARGDER
ncbi:hypothetical protein SCE1572_51660 [Sorangium cellulosum So0157-2]|uniref:Uncharacterized protein n=1 Tax=Sorangium cellulosum So0157-2 TaxID=1254432 RepID=S4YBI4_SORCE|nr:hypothetical protein SCE1572_51660 [Sorangium cellulosum So0157-2]